MTSKGLLMNAESQDRLSEEVANIIENLACRLAEHTGGTLTPNHLMPYLPASLALLKACLDDMVDGTAVLSSRRDGVAFYEFPSYKDCKAASGALRLETCVACDKEGVSVNSAVLCAPCFDRLQKELARLAERTGWPAQAVYEHEILFLAARQKNPVHPEALAGRSRYTLRSMRNKLKTLTLGGFVQEQLEENAGMIAYHFPEIEYPSDYYRANRAIVSTYPDSVTEEVQVKLQRILFALGFFLLGLLVLGFLHVSFPLLVLLFVIGAPIVSFTIWRRRSPVDVG